MNFLACPKCGNNLFGGLQECEEIRTRFLRRKLLQSWECINCGMMFSALGLITWIAGEGT